MNTMIIRNRLKRVQQRTTPRSLVAAAVLALVATGPANAIDLVLDTAVLGEAANTTAQVIKQVENQVRDYALQLQQYQDMVRNTVAPVAWVWNEATQTYQRFRSYADMLQYYANGGGVEGYLSTFQSAGYYAGSPCFTSKGCTWAEIQAIHDRERAANEAQKRANDAQIRGVSLGQTQLEQDASDLAAVQRSTQLAQGRNEMLGASNQLASANANNLLAIRALLLQQQAAENARAATLENREAVQQAADRAALQGQFVPSPALDYGKYAAR